MSVRLLLDPTAKINTLIENHRANRPQLELFK
jgi:hypothetical protein